jgi:NAD(P)-dependent dehydrogenase (short-subunit alcohol dehydrogenase family)
METGNAITEALMSSLNIGYRALVLGASGGFGKALAAQLAEDAACEKLVRLSRRDDGFDVTEEGSVQRAAEALRGQDFDLILCATGALTIGGVGPEKSIRQISQDAMMAQFAVNAVGPALVLKHFAPLLARKRRSLFAFLSARVGSIEDNRLGGWISYRSSKAALNQIVRTAAIEVARTHPASTIVAMHPGTVMTGLFDPFPSGHLRTAPNEAAIKMLRTLDGLHPDDTGKFFAYDGTGIPW